MADHQLPSAGGHPAMDYPAHERTYAAFVGFTKWATIVICGIVVLMAIFLI